MNRGIKNEYNIVKAFNNKKFFELNDFQKKLIKYLYNQIKEDDLIIADICSRLAKPDIYFCVKGVIKFISVKSGKTDSVHFEGIKPFVLFLRKNNISARIQKLLLFFHYGDGTLDGTGKIRMDFEKLSTKYYDFIKEINDAFKDKNIVYQSLIRTVFNGSEGRSSYADYIYHGNENYGILVSKTRLINYVLNKSYDYYRNIHIGPLVLQPYLRDIKRKSKNQFKKHIIQVKWYYLLSDLEKLNEI